MVEYFPSDYGLDFGSIFRNLFNVLTQFITWFNTPLVNGWTPMAILFGSGIFIILGLHVFKLLNPLS